MGKKATLLGHAPYTWLKWGTDYTTQEDGRMKDNHHLGLEGVEDGMVLNVGKRKEMVKAVMWDVIAYPMVPLILEIEFMMLCVRFLEKVLGFS